MRAFALMVFLGAATGCATIFTGTSQRVTVVSDPPEAIVVVVGSPTASLILAAHESRKVTGMVLGLVGPALSPDARAVLEKLDVDELITFLVMWAKLDRVPPELAGKVDQIPPMIRDRLLDLLTIQAVGVAPLAVKLHKGREYAVIAWREGYRAYSAGVHMKFNWVTVLNVFNGFLGLLIDIPTGAWMNLTPGTVEMHLQPLAPS